MANNALRYFSTRQFWKDGDREKKGMNIGEVLNDFSKLQGVACDGAINGIKLDADPDNPPLRLTIETSGGAAIWVLRDCTGAIISQVTATLASSSASASPSASPSVSASASLSASPSLSVSPSASVSPSSSSSSSVSPSPSA